MKNFKLWFGDSIEQMKRIPDSKADMILCDLPYERTKNSWDTIIPFEPLWEQYERIIKPNGAIVLFSDGMFMAKLMLSNERLWRYNIVWDKVLTSGFLNANRMPLRTHEEVCIFYKKLPNYNPQKTIGEKPSHSKGTGGKRNNNNYGDFTFVDKSKELGNLKHPVSIQRFSKPHPSKSLHPTQKSVEFCEWLLKSYTEENDIVVDNTCGSGTTMKACQNLNRRGIGIDSGYCDTDKTSGGVNLLGLSWIEITELRLEGKL